MTYFILFVSKFSLDFNFAWVTFIFFFLSLYSFNPTFQSIPHNSHPQLMALPWVKVHNTQSWVRAIKRLFTALATLNLCFWHKLRCTCPRRDKAQHIILRKDQLGWKERSSLSSNHLDQKRINFIWFLLFKLKWAILNKGLWSFHILI